MGNTSSTHAAPSSAAASASDEQRPAAQPILAPSSSRARSASGPHLPGSLTFHSGLTPPTSPPSPPPASTPPLLPYAGHLSPQNPHCLSHPQAHDYSKSVVTKLILDGQLAPFYRGLDDFEEDWTEEDIGRILAETREKDYAEGAANSYTERLKEERESAGGIGGMAKKIGIDKGKDSRRVLEKQEREKREKRAYLKAVECPICFLNYPPNINTTRCCQQPVCTECFVQIKRSEATITHLESEPACCPFCVETDFGVIYERPVEPLSSLSSLALAVSPADGQSGFSQAMSVGSDADLAVGPGMNPNQKETVRRKSVNAKAKEVVTIDEIRPDWEQKLNAVKAAAARRASRRIVMRQVGDRLVPIGFTSARAPGTADFSMSLPSGDDSGSGSSPRRSGRRRESNRERELEELMIMEAMRLSLVDHEEHQRRQVDDRRGSFGSSPTGSAGISSTAPTTSSPLATSSTTMPGPGPMPSAASFGAPSVSSSRRHSSQTDFGGIPSGGGNGSGSGSGTGTGTGGKDKQSSTSKLLSKLNNVRARANSAASGKSVSFASGTNGVGGGAPASGGSRSTGSPGSPVPGSSPITTTFPSHHNAPTHPRATSAGLSPTSPAPVAVAPVTTLASPGAGGTGGAGAGSGSGSGGLLGESIDEVRTTARAARAGSTAQAGDAPGSAGLPRLSLDMPAMQPEPRNTHKPTASTSSIPTAPIAPTTGAAGAASFSTPPDDASPTPPMAAATAYPGGVGLRRDLSAMSEETEGGLNRVSSGAQQSYAQLESDEE